MKANNLPSSSRLFHMIGYCYVPWPNIKLPLADAQQAADNAATVHSYPHVYIHLVILSNLIRNLVSFLSCFKSNVQHLFILRFFILPDLAYDFDHFEPHFHTIRCVFRRQIRNSGHAVVTVAQDFNSQTVGFLCELQIVSSFLSNELKNAINNLLGQLRRIVRIIRSASIPIRRKRVWPSKG